MINKNTDTAINKKQMFAAKVSIFGWIIIVSIVLFAGIIADSITLLLDASQGLVTLVVALLVRKTLEKLDKPPDDNYHFGYAKYEPLTIAMQGIMIILASVISTKFAVQDIVHPDNIHNYNVAIGAAFLSAVIALIIAFYIRHVAKKTNSDILKISSISWFEDSALSFAITAGFLFAVFLRKMGFFGVLPYVDPVMAIILALFFILISIKTVSGNIFELLDAAPASHVRDNIKKTIEQIRPQHLTVDRLRIRKAGKKIFLEICFIADENLMVKEIHHFILEFEKALNTKIPQCDLVVHYKTHRERTAA